jgi:type I restriction enzyme S subunit
MNGKPYAIPETWTESTIGKVVVRAKQRDPRKKPDAVFQYIDVSSVSNESFKITGATPTLGAEAPSRARKAIETDDVLFATVRPTLKRIALVPAEHEGAIASTGYCVLRCDKAKAEPRFLYSFLITDHFNARMAGLERGASYPAVRDSDVKDSWLPLPPLPEQKKIAYILSAVQRTIEAQERIIQTTTELKKALMHKLFTEGLRNEPQKQTEIGPVPESWEVLTVQDLVDRNILDTPIDGNHGEIHPKVSDFVPEGIPFIMASDLKGGSVNLKTCNFITKERADRLRKGFSLHGDVLISHKATIGETAIVPEVERYIMLTPQVTYYRVLDRDALSNQYLRCYFDSPTFQKPLKNVAGDGSTRAYIGITKQRGLPVLLPGIDEQRELADVSGRLDEKIRQAIAKKNAFSDLFRTLLHELMAAKTRVHKHDFPQEDIPHD